MTLPFDTLAAPNNPSPAANRWQSARATLGPPLAGLLGGALTACITLTAMPTLLANVATTYTKFPSVCPPWLAQDVQIPGPLMAMLHVLGFAGPLLIGLATAKLVRSGDVWGDVSAGLSAGLASTLSSYAVGFGLAVSIATTVVPSIGDLTQIETMAKAGPASADPSAALVERYPDLALLPADQRGGAFMAKIVSDQVVGSIQGVWLGLTLALVSCGLLGFFGTLAGGWLLRRGGSWRSIVVSYGELTISTSCAIGWLLMGWMDSRMEPGRGALLLTVTALVVVGVVKHWPGLVRFNLAIVWFLTLSPNWLHVGSIWPLQIAALTAYGLLVLQLGQLWVATNRRTAVA